MCMKFANVYIVHVTSSIHRYYNNIEYSTTNDNAENSSEIELCEIMIKLEHVQWPF